MCFSLLLSVSFFLYSFLSSPPPLHSLPLSGPVCSWPSIQHELPGMNSTTPKAPPSHHSYLTPVQRAQYAQRRRLTSLCSYPLISTAWPGDRPSCRYPLPGEPLALGAVPPPGLNKTRQTFYRRKVLLTFLHSSGLLSTVIMSQLSLFILEIPLCVLRSEQLLQISRELKFHMIGVASAWMVAASVATVGETGLYKATHNVSVPGLKAHF